MQFIEGNIEPKLVLPRPLYSLAHPRVELLSSKQVDPWEKHEVAAISISTKTYWGRLAEQSFLPLQGRILDRSLFF